MKDILLDAFLIFAALMLLGVTVEAKPAQHKSKGLPPTVSTPADPQPSTKTVQYGTKDVVKLNTKVRFTTLIVLPASENILDFTCGDKEYWVVNGSQNMAYVKPAKEGAMTNLNLITASGNIYTFILVEVSNLPDAMPDLKVFVEPKEQSMISAANDPPRFIPASDLENYRQQIEAEKQEISRMQNDVQEQIDTKVDKILSETKFTYHFDPSKKPFHVKAIWHDSKCTYIEAEPEETPTLYEVRDGKPNLVNFTYKDGLYIADKVIDRGYLAVGKDRLLFVRREQP